MSPCRRVLVAGVALAVSSTADPSGAGWQTYTSGDGLGGNGVNAILVDARDHLWFGTNDGLSHFDGVHWETYRREDGLPTGVVKVLGEDAAGRLWVGTTARPEDGSVLAMIEGARVHRFLPREGLPRDVEAGQFLMAPDGAVWVVHRENGGVSRFQESQWTRFTTELAASTVNTALVARDGTLWFGTEGGLTRYNGTWTSYTEVMPITHLAEDTSGALWVGSSPMAELYRYDGSSFELQRLGVTILELLAARDGSIWVASPGRLQRGGATGFVDIPLPSGWEDGSVEALFEDRDGHVWITRSGGGAARPDGSYWVTFDEAKGLVAGTVSAIAQDHAGNLWFAACCSYSGVNRFDGERWIALPTGGALDNSVKSLLEDIDGTLLVGTGDGLRRVRGEVVENPADTLKGRRVRALLRDASGILWVGTDSGAWHLTDRGWGVELPQADVWAVCQDSSGVLWFGTVRSGGGSSWLIRWNGAFQDTAAVEGNVRDILCDSSGNIWVATTLGDGVLRWRDGSLIPVECDAAFNKAVYRFHEDSRGVLWAANDGGIGRLEGNRFVQIPGPLWLARSTLSIAEDRSGRLWFGTIGGLVRRDGENWESLSAADGIRGQAVVAALADSKGGLWFLTRGGLVRHEADQVAPRAVLTADVPSISTASEQTFSAVAAFGETGVEFSYAVTDSLGMGQPAWSPWSDWGSWTQLLPDGHHVFLVRARDRLGNLQASPTAVSLEIDATPPAPLISAPGRGQVVSGTVRIEGTADDLRYRGHEVAVLSGAGWDILAAGDSAVVNGVLASWNTTRAADGEYTIRLSVSDTLGVTGRDSVRVIVDNLPPFAAETSPARILALEGGHVYTTDAALHLYFPPFAFDEDAVVEIHDATDLPTPAPGTILRSFVLHWNRLLGKAGTLDVALGRDFRTEKDAAVLYVQHPGSQEWRAIGGSLSAGGNRLSAPLRQPGTYAVAVGGTPPAGGGPALSGLTLTPRTLSPSGRLGNREVAVSFILGRPSQVTVRVYSRTGRLVRDLVQSGLMPAGDNLIRWDGQDRDGRSVPSGLYFVTVEAAEESRTASLAVVQ